MNPSPKFQVNELAILESIHFPEDSGEVMIVNMEYKVILYNKSTMKPLPPGWVYVLEGKSGTWAEEALRKKFQKGDMSFKELISDLKTNVPERIS
jgi:hypothetical protein